MSAQQSRYHVTRGESASAELQGTSIHAGSFREEGWDGDPLGKSNPTGAANCSTTWNRWVPIEESLLKALESADVGIILGHFERHKTHVNQKLRPTALHPGHTRYGGATICTNAVQ